MLVVAVDNSGAAACLRVGVVALCAAACVDAVGCVVGQVSCRNQEATAADELIGCPALAAEASITAVDVIVVVGGVARSVNLGQAGIRTINIISNNGTCGSAGGFFSFGGCGCGCGGCGGGGC